MKKIISLILLSVLICGFAGCQSQAEQSSPSENNSVTETSPARSSGTKTTACSEVEYDIEYTYDEATETLTFSGTGELGFDKYSESYTKLCEIEKPTHVVISPGITSIQDYALDYDIEGNTGKERNHFNRIQTVEIADTVEKIGDSAFDYCTGIKAITIPDSVTEIGEFAFSDCSSLESVTISKKAKIIGSMAFNGCKSLKTIEFPSTLDCIEESVCAQCESLSRVVIQSGTSKIKAGAFSSCTGLNQVELGQTLTTIGKHAFIACKNLSEISFPESLKEISEQAFADCDKLTTVTIPKSVEVIGEKAFGKDIAHAKDFKICGYKNSAAEEYAKNNQVEFVALD